MNIFKFFELFNCTVTGDNEHNTEELKDAKHITSEHLENSNFLFVDISSPKIKDLKSVESFPKGSIRCVPLNKLQKTPLLSKNIQARFLGANDEELNQTSQTNLCLIADTSNLDKNKMLCSMDKFANLKRETMDNKVSIQFNSRNSNYSGDKFIDNIPSNSIQMDSTVQNTVLLIEHKKQNIKISSLEETLPRKKAKINTEENVAARKKKSLEAKRKTLCTSIQVTTEFVLKTKKLIEIIHENFPDIKTENDQLNSLLSLITSVENFKNINSNTSIFLHDIYEHIEFYITYALECAKSVNKFIFEQIETDLYDKPISRKDALHVLNAAMHNISTLVISCQKSKTSIAFEELSIIIESKSKLLKNIYTKLSNFGDDAEKKKIIFQKYKCHIDFEMNLSDLKLPVMLPVSFQSFQDIQALKEKLKINLEFIALEQKKTLQLLTEYRAHVEKIKKSRNNIDNPFKISSELISLYCEMLRKIQIDQRICKQAQNDTTCILSPTPFNWKIVEFLEKLMSILRLGINFTLKEHFCISNFQLKQNYSTLQDRWKELAIKENIMKLSKSDEIITKKEEIGIHLKNVFTKQKEVIRKIRIHRLHNEFYYKVFLSENENLPKPINK